MYEKKIKDEKEKCVVSEGQEKKNSWILSSGLLVLTPIIVFWIVQMITVLSVRYRLYGVKSVRQVITLLFTMNVKYQIYNLLILYVIFGIMILIFRKIRIATAVYTILMIIIALVNYYVVMFRGQPFMLLDIVGMGTAADVVGGYHFKVSKLLALTLIGALIFLIFQFKFQKLELGRKGAKNRVVRLCALTVIAVVLWLLSPNVQKMPNVSLWSINKDYAVKGYTYTLLREVKYFKVEKPEGYSAEAVDAIAEEYSENMDDDLSTAGSKVQATNIIMIMNESLTDFEDIGNLKANKEILPFIRSMNKNVKHGMLHMPTFGGGTARSEYEALTGNSIQFLPSGSVPYQLYVRNPEYGMADILKAQGYETIAVHPQKAANWNREKVYQSMGFEKFLSYENWGAEIEKLRSFCSDQSLYDRIIELYKEKEKNQKRFTFCVTMQNHGGYTEDRSLGYEPDVKLDYSKDYPLAEMFLSLERESDKAFQNLIEYFEKVEEPTMIVMFGDHWPNLENGFYSEILADDSSDSELIKLKKKYQTPFVVWTNYDSETEEEEFSSNYLGSYVLELAGVEMPLYNKILMNIKKQLPVIGMGAYCDKNGNWYSDETLPEEYKKLISQYQILQYNDQFEKKNIREKLFRMEN